MIDKSPLQRKVKLMIDTNFFKNKKILITGHTGFKGTWLSKMLIDFGADVTGYALNPPTDPNLFELSGIEKHMKSIIGDIRNLSALENAFHEAMPDIVMHLAAQPLVRDSYINPHYTFETNVMGTVNILECLRNSNTVKSFLNVTTDKVYKNNEWEWGYRENDQLDGFDPYSNSKSCSELVTHSYNKAFFANNGVSISTARAGNVIGGGDFANDRIIPDCVRAIEKRCDIIVRNPHSIRPYQHVIEPIYAYLMIVEKQFYDINISNSYNVGPDDSGCITTGDLTTLFCKKWEVATGNKIAWINKYDGGPHEASFLKLDCSLIRSKLNWKPKWDIETAIEKTVEWSNVYLSKHDISKCMDEQISEFLKEWRL